MKDKRTVIRRLRRLGAVNSFLGRAEVNSLHSVMREGELVEYAISGWYESDRDAKGYGMLVATNQRLIIFDKVFTQIFVEDIPYDMIAEIDYGMGPINGCLSVMARTQKFTFKSIKNHRLLTMARLLEQKNSEYHFPGAQNYGPSRAWDNGFTS